MVSNRESRRRSWLNRNRIKIITHRGRVCANCKSEFKIEELHVHHAVPLSLGGTNYAGNLIVLCVRCHAMAHGRNPDRWAKRIDAQRAGIEQAKAKGKYTGRKKDTAKRKKVVELLRGGHSMRKTAELAGVSLSTVQRVKREQREREREEAC